MNVLLCMPKMPYYFGGAERPMVPAGIAYVSSSLKQAGFNVYTINCIFEERPIYDVLKEMIEKNNINAVGCGDLVVSYEYLKDIIDNAKKINPKIVTFIGGGLVTYSPNEAMTLIPSADYGVIGEGEITTCELLRTLEQNNDVSKVDGIIYRKNDELIITNERAQILNLDEIPFPDHDAFSGEIFNKTKKATVVTSRSCPHRCTFCSHTGYGKKYRLRSIDNLFKEIDLLVDKYKIRSLFLNDELFAVDPNRIESFCNRIKAYKLNWMIMLRVSDSLTFETLQMMKESGCSEIFYGLESADDRILKSMNKHTTIAQIERVLKLTNEAGILITGNFIFGDPEETEETINNTINWIKNNRNLFFRSGSYPIILYPGSVLYNNAVKNKLIDPLEHIKNKCPVVNVSKIQDDVLNDIYKNRINILSEEMYYYHRIELFNIEFGRKINNSYEYTLSCPVCNTRHESLIEASKLSANLYCTHTFTCHDCYFSTTIMLTYAYAKQIENKLNQLLDTEKCAVWPFSNHFIKVNGFIDVFKNNENYVLINSDDSIIGSIFNDKPVYSPDYIQELYSKNDEIKTIIIFSRHHNEIKNQIDLQYPHVKTIFYHDILLI